MDLIVYETLILTKQDVKKILTPAVANETVEKAFRAYSLGCTEMPPKSYLYFPKGDLRSMPAYISCEGFDIAGVKCVTVHPQNGAEHLPTVMAVIIADGCIQWRGSQNAFELVKKSCCNW